MGRGRGRDEDELFSENSDERGRGRMRTRTGRGRAIFEKVGRKRTNEDEGRPGIPDPKSKPFRRKFHRFIISLNYI